MRLNITLPCVSLLLHDTVVCFIAGILIFWWFCNIRVHSLSIAFGRVLCFELRTTSLVGMDESTQIMMKFLLKLTPKIKWAWIIQNQRAVFHVKLQISSVRVLDFVLHMRHNNALGAQLRPGKHRLLCDLNIFSKLKTFRFQEESSYIVIPGSWWFLLLISV